MALGYENSHIVKLAADFVCKSKSLNMNWERVIEYNVPIDNSVREDKPETAKERIKGQRQTVRDGRRRYRIR